MTHNTATIREEILRQDLAELGYLVKVDSTEDGLWVVNAFGPCGDCSFWGESHSKALWAAWRNFFEWDS